MTKRGKLLVFAPLAILAMLFFAFLGGEIVKLLWNWLLPDLFGWRTITFWQALGLLVLCRILFGGFGGHRSVRSNVGRRMRERMHEKWEGMTPEEREKFRDAMRDRWGFVPPTREEKAQ